MVVGASNTANSALDTVNNLEIGGRNLARNTSSDFMANPYTDFNGEANICPYVGNVYTTNLKVGDTITVRLVYKYENIVPADGKTATCWIQGSGNVTEWSGGAFNASTQTTLNGSGEYIFEYSFVIEEEHLKNKFWYVNIRHDYVQSGSVNWKCFKVEKGNKATDWTPAPEDISVENIYTPNTTTIDGGKITTGSIKAEKINVEDLFSKNITATNMTISGDSVFGNFRANTEIEGLAYEDSNYGGIMYLGKISKLINEDEYGFQLGNGSSMTNIQPGGVFVQSNRGGSYSRKTTIHGGFIETYCISTSQNGGTVSIGSDIVPLYSDEDTLLDITLGSSSKKFADLYTSKFNGATVNSDGIASTSGYGVTTLSSSYTSSSTSIAANSNAVYSLYNKMKTIVTRGVATSIFFSCTYANNLLRCVKINSVAYSMTIFGGVIEVTNGSTAIPYQWVPFFQIPEGFRPYTTIQTVVHVFDKNTSRLSATYAVEIYTDGTVYINGSFVASGSFRFVFPCIMYI